MTGIRKDFDPGIHVLLKIQHQGIQIKEVSHVLIRKTMLQSLTSQYFILVLIRPHLSHKDWVLTCSILGRCGCYAWLSALLASKEPLVMFVCVLVAFTAFILQNLSWNNLINEFVAVVLCLRVFVGGMDCMSEKLVKCL